MPSTSKKQRNFMAAIAHSSAFAKKVGVPQSVGKDFNKADKGRKFGKDSSMATPIAAPAVKIPSSGHSRPDLQRMNNPKTNQGANELFKKGGDIMATKMNPGFMAMMAKKKDGMHKMPDGKMMKDSAMKKGGMASGGMPTALAKHAAKPASKAHAGLKAGGMAGGGSFRASANGIAQRGKTKAAMPTMKKGGKC
jgi:hypothetical protein